MPRPWIRVQNIKVRLSALFSTIIVPAILMASLRKRGSSEDKPPLHLPSKSDVHAPPTENATTPSTVTGSRRHTTISLLFLSVLLACGVYIWRNPPCTSEQNIPDTYALCSHDGAVIYTVDDSNPKVQCLVVNKSRFSDIGSLRMLFVRFFVYTSMLTFLLDDVKTRWTNANGPLEDLSVRYIPRGSIVIPGMSGTPSL